MSLIAALMFFYTQSQASTKKLNTELHILTTSKTQRDAEVKKQLDDQQKQIEKLKADIQAKAAAKAAQASLVARVTNYIAPVANASSGLSDAQMEQYIFDNEGQLASINPGGCIGLGQSCPAVRGDSAHAPLALACPDWATNRPCQLNFWHSYMLTHINIDTGRPYGTWAVAYQFKVRHGWW